MARWLGGEWSERGVEVVNRVAQPPGDLKSGAIAAGRRDGQAARCNDDCGSLQGSALFESHLPTICYRHTIVSRLLEVNLDTSIAGGVDQCVANAARAIGYRKELAGLRFQLQCNAE